MTTSPNAIGPVPVPQNVTCYVDGFNLYHGLREHTKTRDYRWLNLRALVEDLLLPDHCLNRIVFFTSVPPWSKAKAHRHQTYVAALKSVGVEIIEGRFQQDQQLCRARCRLLYPFYVEKLTDVNIATELLADAVAGRFDWAYLLSGDADQAPTIRKVRLLAPAARVRVIFPPRRTSMELQQLAHSCLGEISHRKIRANQFPDTIVHGNHTIQKPSKWHAASPSSNTP